MRGKLAAAVTLLVAVVPAAQAADQPQVAVDQDGEASFVWRINDSRNEQVQARQFLTGRFIRFLTDTQYLSAPGRAAFEPQVAVDYAGNATFVWTRFNGTINVIQTRTLRTDGSLTPVQTLSSASQLNFGDHSPQVAVEPTTGNAVFVWVSSVFTGSGVIIAKARTRAADGTLGPIHNLSPSSGPDPNVGPSVSEPQVGVDLNGAAVFTWTGADSGFDDDSIHARRLMPDGTLSEIHHLSDDTREAKDPQVAVDLNGSAIFTWVRFDGADWIVQRCSLSPAGGASTPTDLSAIGSESRDPQVAVAPNVNTAYVWARQVLSGKYTIQTRTGGPAGTTAVQSLSAGGQDASTPQVAIDNDNNAVYTWSRFTGTYWVVQTRRRAFAGGTLSSIENLSTTGASALDPQIAMTGAGNSIIVWRRSSRAGSIIQARTRSETGTLGPVLDLSK